jgi:hypothetical protein
MPVLADHLSVKRDGTTELASQNASVSHPIGTAWELAAAARLTRTGQNIGVLSRGLGIPAKPHSGYISV